MRFNEKTTPTTTINEAGGQAYQKSDNLTLVSMLLTSFIKDQYYRSAQTQLDTIEKLVAGAQDKLFAAKAAVMARREFGMRSVTHALAGEIARNVKGKQWTKDFFNSVVYRPDDMTEIIAYYLNKYGKPLPNALKKGFSMAFQRFDEYQLAKYRNAGAKVSLVDVVNLVHPEHTEAIGRLVNDQLRQHGTWEDQLSEAGQTSKPKSEVWGGLLKEGRLGYFALLRNLRNIAEQAPQYVDLACEQLQDRKRIKGSLVLPFRFQTAIEQIQQVSGKGIRDILSALSTALEISMDNVPVFDGKTLVVLDESSSMEGRPITIGSLFAAVLYKSNDADLLTFTDRARYQNLNPADSVLSIAGRLKENLIGRGTNFHSIFETANQPYDRIIILSDMQGWIGYNTPSGTFNNWKQSYECNPYVYSFDLQGYNSMQFPENQVLCLAGFSDKVFDIMELMETDKHALENRIHEVTFSV